MVGPHCSHEDELLPEEGIGEQRLLRGLQLAQGRGLQLAQGRGLQLAQGRVVRGIGVESVRLEGDSFSVGKGPAAKRARMEP